MTYSKGQCAYKQWGTAQNERPESTPSAQTSAKTANDPKIVISPKYSIFIIALIIREDEDKSAVQIGIFKNSGFCMDPEYDPDLF